MSLKRKRLASVLALTLTAVLSAQTTFAYSNVTLKAGMRGSNVYSLQRDLNELGFMTVKPTGYYGSITKAAVLDMQKQHGLLIDGIAGRQTLGKLDSLMESKAAEAESLVAKTTETTETEIANTESTVTKATETETAEAETSGTKVTEPKTSESETSGAIEAAEAKAADAETSAAEEKPAEARTPERTSRGDSRSAIIDYAKRFIGVKYVWGGTTPKGFDCSGFIKYVYEHFDVALSRNSAAQAKNGSYIKKADLLPGDLVFFDTNGGKNRINHVGIYIGNGKMIQSSSSHNGVVISDIDSGFYSKTYMTARRVLD